MMIERVYQMKESGMLYFKYLEKYIDNIYKIFEYKLCKMLKIRKLL